MALEDRSTRAFVFAAEEEEEELFSALAMEEMGVVMVAEVLGVVGRIG